MHLTTVPPPRFVNELREEKNGTLQLLVGKLLHVYLQSMSENENLWENLWVTNRSTSAARAILCVWGVHVILQLVSAESRGGFYCFSHHRPDPKAIQNILKVKLFHLVPE